MKGETHRRTLNKVYCPAQLGITGAPSTTPTLAMRVLLDLAPPHIVVETEAKKAPLRFAEKWTGVGNGHTTILQELRDSYEALSCGGDRCVGSEPPRDLGRSALVELVWWLASTQRTRKIVCSSPTTRGPLFPRLPKNVVITKPIPTGVIQSTVSDTTLRFASKAGRAEKRTQVNYSFQEGSSGWIQDQNGNLSRDIGGEAQGGMNSSSIALGSPHIGLSSEGAGHPGLSQMESGQRLRW